MASESNGRCLLVLAIFLAGCTSNKITNMTPRILPRPTDGSCTVEVRWDTNQRAYLPESMTPYVVVNQEFYPMQRVALTTNRWEGLVPVPAGQRFLNYRFKFDYLVNGFGTKHPNSRLSPTYQIEVVD